jgi:predicted transcriptional regulator
MECREGELSKVSAVESRVRIIHLLKQKGPLGVNKMSQLPGIRSSGVSQHPEVLKHAGLVRNERKAYWIPYQIDRVTGEGGGMICLFLKCVSVYAK